MKDLNQLSPEKLNVLGVEYGKKGNFDEAIKCFVLAFEKDPKNLDYLHNMGFAYQKKGELAKAINVYKSILKINPSDSKAINNIGTIYAKKEKKKLAVKYFKEALSVNPALTQAYDNLEAIITDEKELSKTINKCHENYLSNNSSPLGYVTLAKYLMDQCDFDRFEKVLRIVNQNTNFALKHGLRPAEEPMFNIITSDNKKNNLDVARAWSDELERVSWGERPRFEFSEHLKGNKIRVGYISGDFREHVMGQVTADLYGLHDRRKFEVYCYSHGVFDDSLWAQRISESADKFIDIQNKDFNTIAKIIYKDKIDILVDMGGFSEYGGPDIMARRAAPIQVLYLGYPGTTGATFYDYLVVDKSTVPKSHQRFYREKLIYMPNSYQINSPPNASEKHFSRDDFDILPGSFVYASFNRPRKFDKKIFLVWLNILKRVDNAVLWLFSDNVQAEKNLGKLAYKNKVNPQRLILTKHMPLEQHLKRLSLADVALDTRLYNGGATTANMLWAEVPVVTLTGKHFLSRMSTSMLVTLGVPELTTNSLKAYEDLAVGLAQEPEKLKKLKNKIKKNKKLKPLFKPNSFVRNLEKAYLETVKLKSQGKKPQNIYVK